MLIQDETDYEWSTIHATKLDVQPLAGSVVSVGSPGKLVPPALRGTVA
jgi:hypothetical protein